MKASVRFVIMQLTMAALLGLLSLFQGCSGARPQADAGGHGAAVRVASPPSVPAVISPR